MTIGVARIACLMPHSHSLKEKRMVLRRLKDRMRQRFNVAIAEVADHDLWQRATVGLAVVGTPRSFVEAALDEVVRFARAEVEVTNVERELQTFRADLASNDWALLAKGEP